jgi:hypothetical protein
VGQQEAEARSSSPNLLMPKQHGAASGLNHPSNSIAKAWIAAAKTGDGI